MEPIVGIGTVIEHEKDVFTVEKIAAQRHIDERGNATLMPFVIAHSPGRPPLVLTGKEVEAAAGL